MIKTRLLKMLHESTIYVAMEIVYQWLALICQIVVVNRLACIVAKTYEKQITADDFGIALGIIIVAVLLKTLFERLYIKASYMASVDVKKVIRQKIYEKLHQLGSSYTNYVPSSQIIQMMGEGVEQLEIYFGKYISQFIYALLAPITLFIYLYQYSFKAAIILLVMVPLIPVVIMVVMKIAKKILDKYFQIYYGLADTFLEKLHGMTTLKLYQADGKAADDMDKEAERFRRVTMKVLSMQLNSTIVMDIISYLGAAIGIVLALVEFKNNNIGLYETIMFLLLSAEFFLPMRLLGSYFHIGMNGMKAADRMFDFMDIELPYQGSEVLSDDPVEISFSGVDFSVNDRDILKDISCSIAPGKITAIVGGSGSGKSTIVKLIRKQYVGYKGEINVDGHELREINEASLMSHMAVVSLESYIFSGTVRDNLLMVDSTKGDDELREVLAQVNLLDEFERQGGLDYVLKEGGSNISGGQKQRLALARALLKDCNLYIFDEATSNIDMESEETIMDSIRSLSKKAKKTIILISHRLANVVDADNIIMLKDGRIIETGNHDRLIADDNEYARLFKLQYNLENMGGEA